MPKGLVVREPFDGYAHGTMILEQEKVAAILASPHERNCVVFWASADIAPPPSEKGV